MVLLPLPCQVGSVFVQELSLDKLTSEELLDVLAMFALPFVVVCAFVFL